MSFKEKLSIYSTIGLIITSLLVALFFFIERNKLTESEISHQTTTIQVAED